MLKKAIRVILGSVITISLITLIWWIVSPESVMSSSFVITIKGVIVFVFGMLILFEVIIYPLYTAQKKALTIATTATVFSKAMSNTKYGSNYFIAFVLLDGTRKNIPLDVNQYNTIGENEEGILTYKEHNKFSLFI